MKIQIACDMEGITGVTRWEHCDSKHPEYQRFRQLMTGDVNAAIDGAFAGGADVVTVSDGHDSGGNILIEALDERAILNCSTFSPWSMMNGIDGGVDGVMFVGYHAKAGTAEAILAHTWTLSVLNLKINGKVIGEFGLNSLIAGYFGARPIMAAGDQTFVAEARSLVPGLETVAVKQATGYFSGYCLPPAQTADMIRAAAKKAAERLSASNAPEPFVLSAPLEIEIEFTMPHMAEAAARVPGAERTDGRVVLKRCQNVPEMFAAMRTFCNLA